MIIQRAVWVTLKTAFNPYSPRISRLLVSGFPRIRQPLPAIRLAVDCGLSTADLFQPVVGFRLSQLPANRYQPSAAFRLFLAFSLFS